MRKLTRLAAVVTMAGVLVGTAATGAQAYPGWEWVASTGWPDHCAGLGYQGVQNGSWDRWVCETVVPANPASGAGYYKLWVQ